MTSLHSVAHGCAGGRLSEHLIERALSLTGKTMYDMYNDIDSENDSSAHIMFCYYLLSPGFLKEYTEIVRFNRNKNEMIFPLQYTISANKFGEAIYEYQLGQLLFYRGEIGDKELTEKYESPLVKLLSKI